MVRTPLLISWVTMGYLGAALWLILAFQQQINNPIAVSQLTTHTSLTTTTPTTPRKSTPHTLGQTTKVAFQPGGAVDPATMVLQAGDYIEISFRDGNKHQITQGKGNGYGKQNDEQAGGLDSGVLAADRSFRIAFPKSGTYYFHDHLNPNFYFTVIVQDAL